MYVRTTHGSEEHASTDRPTTEVNLWRPDTTTTTIMALDGCWICWISSHLGSNLNQVEIWGIWRMYDDCLDGRPPPRANKQQARWRLSSLLSIYLFSIHQRRLVLPTQGSNECRRKKRQHYTSAAATAFLDAVGWFDLGLESHRNPIRDHGEFSLLAPFPRFLAACLPAFYSHGNQSYCNNELKRPQVYLYLQLGIRL